MTRDHVLFLLLLSAMSSLDLKVLDAEPENRQVIETDRQTNKQTDESPIPFMLTFILFMHVGFVADARRSESFEHRSVFSVDCAFLLCFFFFFTAWPLFSSCGFVLS